MGELAPKEQLQVDIEAARQAAQEAGHYSVTKKGEPGNHLGGREERIGDTGVFNHGPGMIVGTDNVMGQTFRVEADVRKKTPDSRSAYGIYQADNADGREDGSVEVNRTGSNGERYSHTYRNPDTARKFASLVAKQVVERSKTEDLTDKRAA